MGKVDRGWERGMRLSTGSTKSTLSTKIYHELSANVVIVLIAEACSLLDRQVERLAKDFENQGGFTERLYRGALLNGGTEHDCSQKKEKNFHDSTSF